MRLTRPENAVKQAKVQNKIDKDLEGAVQDWSYILKKWVFVYNAKRGTSSDIKLTLQQKQKQYPDIEIDSWSNDYLWEITRELSLQQRSEILGASPQWNVEKAKSKAYIPNLPFHFLKRSTDLDTLKNLVFSGSNQSIGITRTALKVGVYGMGGIGKSVLAATLARDPEVRAAFPDGIFWITLGQEPPILARQLDLARSLGDASLSFQDVPQGKIHLSQLLGDKTCLLILDDVWKADHVDSFNILGEQSGLLFTTRDSRIVKALNASEHRVDLLSDDEALELLTACSGQCQETLPIAAHEIVRECGNLPLALSMIGAIAKARPNRWDNLLHKLQNADLDKIRHEFPDYPYPDLLKAIQVSVDALEPTIKVRYLDFAVFPEDTAIPETTLRTFWELEGLDEYDTQDVIDTLVERSLARRDETGNLNLHDLQYDYVRKQAADLPALHNKLLAAYAIYCPQGWHTFARSDEYFFEYLTYHLKESGRQDELHNLLVSLPAWMEAKFIACCGDASYVADLDFVIKDFSDPIDSNQLPILIQLYAARQAVNQRTQYYDDNQLEALAWLGRLDEAISYARLRSEPIKRFYGLVAISNALQENEKICSSLLKEAWEIAQAIESNWMRACLLGKLAVALYKVGQVAEANSITAEACNIAYSIRYKTEQDDALCKLVSALTQMNCLKDASKVAHDIEERWSRAEAMGDLAAGLLLAGCDIEAEEAFSEALDLAQEHADLEDFHEPWISVCSKWAEALAKKGFFVEAMEWIEGIEDSSRVEVLCNLAVTLAQVGQKAESDKIFDEVKEVANLTESNNIRVSILRHLVVALAQIGNEVEADLVLAEIKNLLISNENSSVVVTLGKLALALTQAGYKPEADLLFSEAREIMQSINQKYKKEWALGKLAISLSHAGYETLANLTLIEMKESIGKRSSQRELVKVIAECRYFSDAREIAETIQDEKEKVLALRYLAEELAKFKQFQEAESLSQNITSSFYKVSALIVIAEEMMNYELIEDVERILIKAKEFILIIEDPMDRAIALIELAKSMVRSNFNNVKEIFSEVGDAINRIDNRMDRDYVLMEYVDGHSELEIGLEIDTSSWESEPNHKQSLEKMALKLAYEQHFSAALSIFSKRPILSYSSELEDFFEMLGLWLSTFDNSKARSSLAILREAIRIVGWTNLGWQKVYKLIQSKELKCF